MSCAICETRKEKRFCPAVHGRICPVCCGTEREVTLDCPSECPYLQQARKQENTDYLRNLDRAAMFPQIDVPPDFLYQHEPLLGGMSFAVAQAARADSTLHDRDVSEALTSMVKSYERLVNSGLVYEEKNASLIQQALIAALQNTLQEYRAVEEKQLGYSRLRDSEVLKALVFLLRLSVGKTSGRPKSRAFLDFVCAQFKASKDLAAPPEGSRIITP